jgi:predicted cupin superfamily sugar epimerase
MKTANYWIEALNLQKHPEGGWFKETYRSSDLIPSNKLPDFKGNRNFSTSIYYLMEGTDFSAFHRIKSDEIWHYYSGNSAVEIISIVEGQIHKIKLGKNYDKNEFFQVVVQNNKWFAARLVKTTGFALMGCTVSPGFHYDDFEMAHKSLLSEYPAIREEIKELIK